MRADHALVARGLAPSRSAARRLVEDGAVFVRVADTRLAVTRPARDVADGHQLDVVDSAEIRYVSRAGAKLAGALAHCRLDVAGYDALDVGMSTGGFTDCLLRHGARSVVGVDVGHRQLHRRLRDDPRVIALEGVNARHLDRARLGAAMPPAGFELIVADVSFISLTLVLPAVLPLAAPHGRLLALVKPQFELDAQALDARGVVRDPALYATVRRRIGDAIDALGWRVCDFFDSELTGGDGNREFFIECSA